MKKIMIVMAAMTLIAGSVSAALVTEYNVFETASKTNATVDLGTSVAADAGDVIVFTASSSKSYVKSFSIASGDGGSVGAEVSYWPDKNVTIAYYPVSAGGTFDLSVAGNELTFDSFGAYVLGSDQPGYSVVEIASDTSYVGANVSVTNILDYGVLSSAGIAIEGAQAASFASTPSALTVEVNSGNSRSSAYGNIPAGAYSSEYISTDITKNQRAAGVVFGEVIPEPATLGLLSFTGILVMFMRRRFKA